MTTATWEKSLEAENIANPSRSGERWKFLVGGGLLLAAIVYLIVSSTVGGTQYFVSVDDVVHDPAYIGQTVRIAGAVLGDTIEYDAQNLILDFTVANMSTETDDLAAELHAAVSDPSRTQLSIHLENEVIPDLLQHEAQAILTGTMGEDGIFYANELLLKCPSRYEETLPQQVAQNAG